MLKIADKTFCSRLFTGTGKFSSSRLMEEALLASGSELVTVALKRVDLKNNEADNLLLHLKHAHINLMPNTSGVRNAKEAVFAAQLAREALETNWIKLEIHPDPKTARTDGPQSLDLPQFAALMDEIAPLALFTGRPLAAMRTKETAGV